MSLEINNANYPEQALAAMKMRPPNPDGTIGVTIRPDMPEWAAWQAYLFGKRMDNRASFMRSRGMNGYMVPCRNPGDFDPLGIREARQEYAARLHNGEIPRPDNSRKAHEIPSDERAQMAAELQEIGERIARKHRDAFAPPKGARNDARSYIPEKAEPKPFTEADAADLKRLMGVREQKDAAE